MKKLTIISHTLFLLSIVLTPLFFIWGTIEYILYKIINTNYNPISLYFLIGCLVLFIITFISSFILANKYEIDIIERYKDDDGAQLD